jgi:hypothetical protein
MKLTTRRILIDPNEGMDEIDSRDRVIKELEEGKGQ